MRISCAFLPIQPSATRIGHQERPCLWFVQTAGKVQAETVIHISAALVGKGMGAGASIPGMIILGSMFKKKLIFAFALNVFLVAIVAGYLVDLLIY